MDYLFSGVGGSVDIMVRMDDGKFRRGGCRYLRVFLLLIIIPSSLSFPPHHHQQKKAGRWFFFAPIPNLFIQCFRSTFYFEVWNFQPFSVSLSLSLPIEPMSIGFMYGRRRRGWSKKVLHNLMATSAVAGAHHY